MTVSFGDVTVTTYRRPRAGEWTWRARNHADNSTAMFQAPDDASTVELYHLAREALDLPDLVTPEPDE